jgi:hypothetical protein
MNDSICLLTLQMRLWFKEAFPEGYFGTKCLGEYLYLKKVM